MCQPAVAIKNENISLTINFCHIWGGQKLKYVWFCGAPALYAANFFAKGHI
jgi:hypothetical protein